MRKRVLHKLEIGEPVGLFGKPVGLFVKHVGLYVGLWVQGSLGEL